MVVSMVMVFFCPLCRANPPVLQPHIYYLCHFLLLFHVEFSLCTLSLTAHLYAPAYNSNECKNDDGVLFLFHIHYQKHLGTLLHKQVQKDDGI